MLPCKDHGCRGNVGGYHTGKWQGRYTSKHRIVYCQHNGTTLEDIAGRVVRHKCDNARCIEPTHLEVGSQTDNLNDRKERHRYRKLTRADAEAIKMDNRTTSVIAAQYAVSTGMIRHIKAGRHWK